ncbi:MAG: YqaJ viral recombinase family protein, partial [Chloroflexi bacterium]|nr:YqaJ viral recombinase family protein [Chloroflexota bacterium]
MTASTFDTPTGVLVGTFAVRSEEWFAARADGLGGSEIAAVLGLSPYESRFALWHRKAGRAGQQPENEEMEWGKRLEPAVCEKFAELHPEYLMLPAGTYAHEERPWQLGNPDRLLYEYPADQDRQALAAAFPKHAHTLRLRPVAVLESKISLYGDGWGDAGTDEIPVHVRAQVLWYLDTLGLRLGHVAVLIGGHDYREYSIRTDDS